jgi:1-deoxyxylulose-5-phosphate synthase
MQKRALDRTNIEVSEISFGTVSLGLPYGIGISGKKDMICEKDAVELLRSALDKGINFFDTALEYGTSEEILCKAFKDRREKAVICTKPAHFYDSFLGQKLPSDNEIKSKLNNSLEQSLLGLQTDYIDIYMSHDGTEEVINNETVVDFYQKKKQEGTIRAIGVSVYTLEQSLAAINSGIWDVIQLQFNLMDQRQLPAIELASQKGIGIVVRSALFRGILTDRGSNLHPELKSVQDHREKCLSLVQGNIKTLSELATKFILSIKDVTSVLVGIDKSEYLQSALEVADGNYLDEKILEKAKELAYPDPEFLNLPIWDRKGWL